MLYQWRGKEECLGITTFTTRSLTVEFLEESGEALRAHGLIEVVDYMEGFLGNDDWEAEGRRCPHGVVTWKIRPGGERHFIFEDDKPAFTFIPEANRAIEVFVAGKLNVFLALRSKAAAAGGPVIDTEPSYAGPKIKYEGPCVCKQISRAYDERTFQWLQITQGGQFPKRCFECSCGARWWHPGNYELWVRVKDDKAWEMLLARNGEPGLTLAFINGGVELLETVRKRGLIPLG